MSKDLISSSDVFFRLDEDLRILDCPGSIKNILGITKQKFTGTKFFDHFQKLNEKEVMKSVNKMGYWNGQVELNIKNKGQKNFFISIVKDAGKKNIVFNVHLFKLGEIKQTEMTDKTLNYFPGFTSTTELAGNEEFSVINEDVINLTGYTADEINKLPGKLLSIIYKDDIAYIIKTKNNFLKHSKENLLQLYYRIIQKNGKVIWIQENIYKEMWQDNSAAKYYSTFFDVSFLKEKETVLQTEIEDLKEANISKDRFVTILAHELRGPFTSILGFSEILLSEPDLPVNEKNEYLTYIYEASKSQIELINYLLDWSRLKTGNQKIEMQHLRVAMLIYQCVSTLTGNAVRKNIEIKVNADENIFVRADERLMQQVFLNLINNAIKFSFENSTVEISVSRFNNQQAEIVIKDSGKGLTQEEQQKIFSLEKNFSKEGTKGEKGNGLGLALVKEIIEKHNGNIWFYSEEDKGTEFHFLLPLSNNTVLLVLNDEKERKKIAGIIKQVYPEANLCTARNGYEAIELLSDSIPNLIIANHNLPLMNGLQLVESVDSMYNNFKSPVIIFIDKIDKIDKAIEGKYNKYPVKLFLNKPFDNDEFRKVLQSTFK
jgi:signal transduction histidine kinase